jgi:hypothetical protein
LNLNPKLPWENRRDEDSCHQQAVLKVKKEADEMLHFMVQIY